MIFVILILLILFLVIFLLFKYLLLISLLLDTDQNVLNLNIKWLYPFFESNVTMLNNKPFITIFLFNKKVYSKVSQKREKQKNKTGNYSFPELRDINLRVSYSIDDPFPTGIISICFNAVQLFSKDIIIDQYPDFISDHAYIVLEADGKLNLGDFIIQNLKSRYYNNKIKRSKKDGSVQFG